MSVFGHEILTPDLSTPLSLPIFLSPVMSAGFPSPAEDYLEGRIDLNKELIKHPAASFVVRVKGNSMIGAGIHPEDRLIVDRALEPRSGNIVIGVINGELVVKRLMVEEKRLLLASENPQYSPLVVREETDFQIWGVVVFVIHKP